MCLDKIRDLIVPIVITIVAIIFGIVTYLILGNRPETFIAIATIALVAATIYIAYFNMKLWIAQDKPWLYFFVKKVDFFIGEPTRLGIYVKNVGKGVAFDIKYQVEAPINKSFNIVALSPNEEFMELLTPIDQPVNGESIREMETCIRSNGIRVNNIIYFDINERKINQKPHVIKEITYSST
jgi:hypothetical protein